VCALASGGLRPQVPTRALSLDPLGTCVPQTPIYYTPQLENPAYVPAYNLKTEKQYFLVLVDSFPLQDIHEMVSLNSKKTKKLRARGPRPQICIEEGGPHINL